MRVRLCVWTVLSVPGAMRGVHPDGSVACTNAMTSAKDGVSEMGLQPSLAIGPDGRPVITHDESKTSLRVTHCDNAACTAARKTRVDTLDLPHGYDTSIAVGAERLPVVAHYVKGAGALRITKCGTVTCQ